MVRDQHGKLISNIKKLANTSKNKFPLRRRGEVTQNNVSAFILQMLLHSLTLRTNIHTFTAVSVCTSSDNAIQYMDRYFQMSVPIGIRSLALVRTLFHASLVTSPGSPWNRGSDC